MKRCPKCQIEYKEESRFCPRDGQKLETYPTPSSQLAKSVTEERQVSMRDSLAAGAIKLCPECGTEFKPQARYCYRDGARLQEIPLPAEGDEDTLDEKVVEEVEKPDEKKDQLLGRTIAGHYKLVKKIGQGGMGLVYKAEHVRISRPSAIKILNPELASNPELVARFEREAEMASRINHPNAVGIYDAGEEEDGLVYIALEFVNGEPLSKIIRREGPLPLDKVVNVARQVADALDAAHQLDIVHRDLKPDNVMICRRAGKPDWVKVVDFGIAKQARHGIGYKSLTQRGVILGTPEYMSPEQLLRKPLDPRSDIYSLGLVVFKALTGKAAFEGLTPQARMIKKLSEPPLLLKEARPELKVSPQIEEVVRKALEPDPELRYQTAVEFAADLDRAARSNAVYSVLAGDDSESSAAIDSMVVPVDIANQGIDLLSDSDRFPAPPLAAVEGRIKEAIPVEVAAPAVVEAMSDTRAVPALVETKEHAAINPAAEVRPTGEARAPIFQEKSPVLPRGEFKWRYYIIVAVLLFLILLGVAYAMGWIRAAQSATAPSEQPTTSEEQPPPEEQRAAASETDEHQEEKTKPDSPRVEEKKDKEEKSNSNTAVANDAEEMKEPEPKPQPVETAVAPEPPKEEAVKKEAPPEAKEAPPEVRVEEKPPETTGRSAGVVHGQALSRVSPIYPSEARARRISGIVVVEVEISKKGKVKSARALTGNVLLRGAAVTAALQWKFAPSTLNGSPVKSTRVLNFHFNN
jgi:TonB family protein